MRDRTGRGRVLMRRQRVAVTAVVAVLATAVLLAGCGAWSKTTGPFAQADHAVQVPAGWYRLKDVDRLLLTREGPSLQSVQIFRMPAVGTLPHSQRPIDAGMLPIETAAAISDDLSFDASIGHFEVVESGPAVVGGRPAFRFVAVYRDVKDLQYKMVYYGVLRGWWFYGLRYDAPLRNYFDRDVAVFERMVDSFAFR